jgi:hypothetical protein
MVNDCELAEVLVQGHEYTARHRRMFQDLVVSRILGPAARPFDVVAGGVKRRRRAAPNARIEQNLHGPGFKTKGSIRSCATTRRA